MSTVVVSPASLPGTDHGYDDEEKDMCIVVVSPAVSRAPSSLRR